MRFSNIIVLFVCLFSIRFFDYVNYDDTVGGWVIKFICLILLIVTFLSINDRIQFKKQVLALAFLPMVSVVPAYLEHSQPILMSLNVYLPYFLILIYFLLLKINISAHDLIKILIIIAVVRTSILIIQQFTYPLYYFALRKEGYDFFTGVYRDIEVRSGLYRFYISDTYYGMFLVFYGAQKLFSKYSIKSLLLFAIGLLSVYIDQSRQFIFSTLLTLVIYSLLRSNVRNKKTYILLGSLIAIIVYFNFNTIFGDLLQLSQRDINEDNIRLMSYATYLNYWGGPLSVLFGNGVAGPSGSYADEMYTLTRDLLQWRADVGVVGLANLFGVGTLILYLHFFITIIKKYWKVIDPYILMFAISVIINIPLITYYTQGNDWMLFWGLYLYLLEKSYHNNVVLS